MAKKEIVNFRVSSDELAYLKTIAQSNDKAISDIIREKLGINYGNDSKKTKWTRCKSRCIDTAKMEQPSSMVEGKLNLSGFFS